MKRQRNPAGFTLIDLMICIAIVSILVAMAIPDYLYAQKRAVRVEGMTLLSAVTLAQAAYHIDRDKYMNTLHELTHSSAMPAAAALKFYRVRSLASGNYALGFLASAAGQLDDDIAEDMLLLKVGNPQMAPFNTTPTGISILIDDLVI